MGNDDMTNGPDLTIVGGQPSKRRNSREKIQVPVGLEKILFHAARDDSFKKLLLADRDAAIEKSRVSLRPSERAMLSVATDGALEAMIARIIPTNPKKRKFMSLVAAAATSLAAGTVLVAGGCDAQTAILGSTPDEDIDGSVDSGDTDSDSDTDTDTDTDSDTDTVDTDTGGPYVDAGVGSDTDTDSDTE